MCNTRSRAATRKSQRLRGHHAGEKGDKGGEVTKALPGERREEWIEPKRKGAWRWEHVDDAAASGLSQAAASKTTPGPARSRVRDEASPEIRSTRVSRGGQARGQSRSHHRR